MEQAERQRQLQKVANGDWCGAKTRTHALCKNKPLDNGRCKLHGGKSLKMTEHPSFKTGKYSRYIPERLLEKYKMAESDDILLTLKSEINLIDTRLLELVEKVGKSKGRREYKELIKLFDSFVFHKRNGNSKDQEVALAKLEVFLAEEQSDMEIWDEITNHVELRRKLVESERKRMLEAEQYLTVEQVMVLIGALTDIVVNEVEDEDTVNRIAKKFGAITKRGSVKRDVQNADYVEVT